MARIHISRQFIHGVINDEYCQTNTLDLHPLTDITRKGFEILNRPLPPVCLPSVYLMSLHVIKISQAFPSVFTYCKQLKTGGGNRLGARLIFRLTQASALVSVWVV